MEFVLARGNFMSEVYALPFANEVVVGATPHIFVVDDGCFLLTSVDLAT